MATSRKRTTARLHLLTARQVLAASEGDHADGGGLLLRVRGSSVAWVFRYTAPTGRRREMGLGIAYRGSLAQAGDTLTAARDKAHEARQLLRDGTDPLEAKEQRREALRKEEAAAKAKKARQHWTLARCARDYHERTIEPTKSAKHAAQWIASLENHMPPSIWRKPIADIEPPELLEAFSQVKPHERARRHKSDTMPETLQRMRQRLDAVFEDAIFHKRCTSNPAAAIRRKMRETLPRKAAGQFAALPYHEAPALMAQIRSVEGIAARCLEFAVLTTARTSEAIGAMWAEIDLQAGVWVVPAERTKAKEQHTVYLSPRALEVLAAVQGLDADWVFPSPRLDGKSMSNMAMLMTLKRLGVRDRTTVHGLCRATFSTWANETGAARPDVIEACLAHEESNRVRAAYNRAQFADERRALLAAWAGFLAGAKIIPLKERAA